MNEKLAEIRKLLFHPEFGGTDPSYSLAFASGVLGRNIDASDVSLEGTTLKSEEEELLLVALQNEFPSMFDTTVQALGRQKK